MATSFTVDQSGSPMTGLWWNQNEPGWGVSIIQQYDVLFVIMHTFDGRGAPVWYFASNCAVFGNGCSGDLYQVTGGSMPTVAWNGTNKTVATIGTLKLAFTTNNAGSMNYTINGASETRTISKEVFATAPAVPSSPIADTCTTSNFTPEKYNWIENGMTLYQVGQIIGCEYDQTHTQVAGAVMSYQWFTQGQGKQAGFIVYFNVMPFSTAFSVSTAPVVFKQGFGF